MGSSNKNETSDGPRFTKLHAVGNDFLVVESEAVPAGAALADLASALCDRHFGAGADGLIVVARGGADVDCSSRIFNADGSEAEVSGNGTRCLAAWLDVEGHWPAGAEAVRIATVAGVKRVRMVERAGPVRRLEMEMGVPRLASAQVPMLVDPPLERVVAHELEVGGTRYAVTALSIGNPHCTLFVDDLDAIDWRAVGAAIERHAAFPERVNVEFVHVEAPDRIRVRFWERGVGVTLSSGTGSSAAVVAAALNGLAGRRVTVETPAGPLEASWRELDGVVLLAGPAEVLYTGTWIGGSKFAGRNPGAQGLIV
jgi:diaminopimelate epimerase